MVLIGMVSRGIKIVNDKPFVGIFTIRQNQETVVACLVGDVGKPIQNSLQVGDSIELDGFWESGKTIGFDGHLFMVEKLQLSESAKLGNNLNVYY